MSREHKESCCNFFEVTHANEHIQWNQYRSSEKHSCRGFQTLMLQSAFLVLAWHLFFFCPIPFNIQLFIYLYVLFFTQPCFTEPEGRINKYIQTRCQVCSHFYSVVFNIEGNKWVEIVLKRHVVTGKLMATSMRWQCFWIPDINFIV